MNLYNCIRGTAMALLLAIPVAATAASLPVSNTYSPSEEANMQTARDVYHAIFTARDFKVAERYMGPEYIQHATGLIDGKAGVARRIDEIKVQFPQISYEIKHITAEGDLVVMMTHIRRSPGTLGLALFHIYRFDAGKIIEHWETWQDIPETSANGNGIF